MQIRGLVMSQGVDFEVTHMILDQVALPSVQLPFTYSRRPVGSIIILKHVIYTMPLVFFELS